MWGSNFSLGLTLVVHGGLIFVHGGPICNYEGLNFICGGSIFVHGGSRFAHGGPQFHSWGATFVHGGPIFVFGRPIFVQWATFSFLGVEIFVHMGQFLSLGVKGRGIFPPGGHIEPHRGVLLVLMCQWCYILHCQVLGPQPIVLQGEHGSGSYPRTISPLYCILSRCSREDSSIPSVLAAH